MPTGSNNWQKNMNLKIFMNKKLFQSVLKQAQEL